MERSEALAHRPRSHDTERMASCIFCDIIGGTAGATVVYEDESVLGFLPLPEGRLADGHVLVVPKRHVSDLFDATRRTSTPSFSGCGASRTRSAPHSARPGSTSSTPQDRTPTSPSSISTFT